jgi:hypothetical protein
MKTLYWVFGAEIAIALAFALAAKLYNRKKTGAYELSPDYFRAPSTYIVAVAGVAFPLIGAIFALQPPERTDPEWREVLLAGMGCFGLSIAIGAWMINAIVGKAKQSSKDMIELKMPGDWPYKAAIGISYAFLLMGLADTGAYFWHFGSGMPPVSMSRLEESGRVSLARPRPRLGESRDEVARALGEPESRGESDRLWNYEAAASSLALHFSVDGHVESIGETAKVTHGQ